jgi:ABC-2 type transport system permease protein
MKILLHQLRYEQLLFWRAREAAFFIFLFPVLLLLLLGSVYDGEIDGIPAASYLLIGMLGYGAANTGFAGLAIQLVLRREHALLKRIRATPLDASRYLGCLLVSNLFVFAIQAVAIVVLGILLFGFELPDQLLSFVVALVFGAASFTGLGLAAAALIRSDEAVAPAVNAIVLPMAFLSGAFGPTDGYPRLLQLIGDVLPLSHLIDILTAIVRDGEPIWEQGADVAVVAAWGAAGLLVAVRRFRWEPVHGVT